MTSIYEIKDNNDLDLLNFLNGVRSKNYTVPEEKGFHTTGNIGSLLNSNLNELSQIKNGIIFNPTNKTDSSNTIVGKVSPSKKDWRVVNNEQPPTPLLYCNQQPLSELMPYYPNGIPNILLNPTCNMTINGFASPTLYGGSTMGINNPKVFNNENNDIGHELNAYGIAKENGTRALCQGKFSCEDLPPGLNVPPLSVTQNNDGVYIANPALSLDGQKELYQVGNWSDPNLFPHNFINEFNQNVGQCQGPSGRRPGSIY